MRRKIAVLLAVLLCVSFSAQAALDASWAKENPELYRYIIDTSRFARSRIDTGALLDVPELSFSFDGASSTHYSYMRSELELHGLDVENCLPVWRTRIHRFTEEDAPVISVIFTINGTEYNFTDLETEIISDDDVEQIICITHGPDSLPFLTALRDAYLEIAEKADVLYDAVKENADITVTLCGTTDEKIRLPAAFLMDAGLIGDIFFDGNEAQYLSVTEDATPCTVIR